MLLLHRGFFAACNNNIGYHNNNDDDDEVVSCTDLQQQRCNNNTLDFRQATTASTLFCLRTKHFFLFSIFLSQSSKNLDQFHSAITNLSSKLERQVWKTGFVIRSGHPIGPIRRSRSKKVFIFDFN